MLETRDLVKIYRPQKGVPVTALDKITLKFPDKGMVFLLGKSGSGKSTLLNVLGGLDRYNSGEILIKGVSSKDFKQSHFDSYRNTYVGFIFQEYNILEEFSVGANIALALQLQGKKPTDEIINKILHEVDLDGYGNRKPNELSGGQKQRVSIARALVKSPEIIMADEPTGALDSVTGQQVLETLKKLSKEKLVIVVSHDREFAETYADRIIELEDGKVIRDVTKDETAEEQPEEGPIYEDAIVTLPQGYKLTEEDRKSINEYIDSLQGSGLRLFLSGKSRTNKIFRPTEERDIRQSGGAFRLIRSRLPFRFAFPMGASSLKHKKIRLVFTILLSCVAFGLFGLADTFASYDHVNNTTQSLIDSDIRYASVEKKFTLEKKQEDYTYSVTGKLSDRDLKEIETETGVRLQGVYTPYTFGTDFSEFITDWEWGTLYATSASGITEIDNNALKRLDASLVAGTLPQGGEKEIALSTYLFETFREFGYRAEDGTETKIKNYGDLIGKTLRLGEDLYTVTGIVETGLDLSRYDLLTKDSDQMSDAEQLLYYALRTEFSYAVDNSLAGLFMVGDGTLDQIRSCEPSVAGTFEFLDFSNNDLGIYLQPSYLGKLSDNGHLDFVWLDGTERTELKDDEIILPLSQLQESFENQGLFDEDPTAEFDLSQLGTLTLTEYRYTYNEKTNSFEETSNEYKVVGVVRDNGGNFLIAPDGYVKKHTVSSDGAWRFAIGNMPETRDKIRSFVEYCYEREDNIRYDILNPVCFELNAANSVLKVLADVFLWVGIGFALFAALLFSNFISTSIAYKKQQIGILRAIGSRGNDVFRIFFSESFVIAMINFVLSTAGTLIATLLINYLIRRETGLLITLLTFSVRQVALLFAVSIAIAAIASFLPVKKIASKRPIDAIRNR